MMSALQPSRYRLPSSGMLLVFLAVRFTTSVAVELNATSAHTVSATAHWRGAESWRVKDRLLKVR
jgi:hypothetical protein